MGPCSPWAEPAAGCDVAGTGSIGAMDDDRRRWDERYVDQLPPPPLPPLGLSEVADGVPAGGAALDIACGLGSTAVWAAGNGFEVLALDVSPVAIAKARELAARLGVEDRARFRVHDLDAGLPPDAAGPFELIVCQRYRRPQLYPAIAERLVPGGVAVVTVLSAVGAKGRPGRFAAAEGELVRSFGHLEVLYAVEGAGEATVVARRPGAR